MKLNYRKKELDESLLSGAKRTKWFVQQCVEAGALPEDALAEHSVDRNALYCPECDAVSSDEKGCPVHGVWW